MVKAIWNGTVIAESDATIMVDKQKPISKMLMSVFLNVYFSAEIFIMVPTVEQALQFLQENTNYAKGEV